MGKPGGFRRRAFGTPLRTVWSWRDTLAVSSRSAASSSGSRSSCSISPAMTRSSPATSMSAMSSWIWPRGASPSRPAILPDRAFGRLRRWCDAGCLKPDSCFLLVQAWLSDQRSARPVKRLIAAAAAGVPGLRFGASAGEDEDSAMRLRLCSRKAPIPPTD